MTFNRVKTLQYSLKKSYDDGSFTANQIITICNVNILKGRLTEKQSDEVVNYILDSEKTKEEAKEIEDSKS